MKFFKRNEDIEYGIDYKFDKMMGWVKKLDRKNYNKLKKAMDLNYESHRVLTDLDKSEDIIMLQNFDNNEMEEL